MDFSEDQKNIIRGWVEEGCGLSEIQRRLSSELGATMTYMDVRFLVLDLDAAIKEDEPPPAEPVAPDAGAVPPSASDSSESSAGSGSGTADAPVPAGGVSVEVDVLMRPGALLSGSVCFSDGVTAVWMLDQAGRLAIEPSQPDYHPTEADNAEFVKALQAEIAKKGF
jgi:hypothetical protein